MLICFRDGTVYPGLQYSISCWEEVENNCLTSLRKFHMTTGNNHQVGKIGDVVLVHDDAPRKTSGD